MAYDPSKPVEESPLDAAEMRSQLNALKALIDAQGAQIAALQVTLATAVNERAFKPRMGEFDPGFSDPPAVADLQNVQTVINDLITQLENG